MKITSEVRVLPVPPLRIRPYSLIDGLIHVLNLLIDILYIIYNQAATKNKLFSIKEMKCVTDF
jgi:hypothetical protein